MAEVVRAIVHYDGDVQGVGFRYYARRTARRLRLVGSVKNLEDGRVETICEGPRDKVEEFINLMKQAPAPIHVDEADTRYTSPTGEFRRFNILLGDVKQEIAEGFGTGSAYFEIMFQKQDLSLSKQDQSLSKQDQMLSKQDQSLSKQDQMLSKQDAFQARPNDSQTGSNDTKARRYNKRDQEPEERPQINTRRTVFQNGKGHSRDKVQGRSDLASPKPERPSPFQLRQNDRTG
ncbi:MAG: acylphosphatase [Thaumarchaeota archaeon]|nr:acylphosphatase [Nitrososphaerota archaeon]